jgi:hypothetical protein
VRLTTNAEDHKRKQDKVQAMYDDEVSEYNQYLQENAQHKFSSSISPPQKPVLLPFDQQLAMHRNLLQQSLSLMGLFDSHMNAAHESRSKRGGLDDDDDDEDKICANLCKVVAELAEAYMPWVRGSCCFYVHACMTSSLIFTKFV